MASLIDPSPIDATKPEDGTRASKTDLRNNLAAIKTGLTAAKSEIESLQSAVGVNVRDFGAAGDGVTDDTDAVVAAITAALGGTVIFPAGTYVLNTGAQTINLTGNLTIFCQGKVTLVATHAGSTTLILNAEEILIPTYSGTNARGDFTIAVDITEDIEPGDLLIIRSNVVFETTFNYVKRDVHLIESVLAGESITTETPLTFAYDSGAETVTLSVRKRRKVTILGDLTLTYPPSGGGTPRVLDLNGTVGSKIDGICIIDPQRRKGSGPDPLFIANCINTRIFNVYAEGARYCINVGSGSRDTLVRHIHGEHAWQLVDFNSASYRGYVENVTGFRVTSSVGCHPAFEIHYKDVRCIGGGNFHLRSVGGSLKNIHFETDEAVDNNGFLFQNVTLSTDVYSEYDFVCEDVTAFIPNATELIGIGVHQNQRRAVFRNVNVPQIICATASGSADIYVSDSRLHQIRSRGNNLYVSNTEFVYELENLPSGLRVTFPLNPANANLWFLSNVTITGAYTHVLRNYICNGIYLNNFVIDGVTTDFLDSAGGGNTTTLHVVLTNGKFLNCVFPMTTYNSQRIMTDNILTSGGSGKLLSRKRGTATTSTDGSGNISIAHGLYTTPTFAQVAAVGDVTYQATVQSIDATNIVVRAAAMSDGSDITSTSIAVRWEAEVAWY